MRTHFLIGTLALVAATACKSPADAEIEDPTVVTPVTAAQTTGAPAEESEPTTQPSSAPASGPMTIVPEASAVQARVASARDRLAATPEGQLVWKAIEAHGGLAGWLGSGALAFRFNYQPLGDRGPTDTYQIVTPWSSLAHHTLTSDESVTFGWNGQTAWINPPDAEVSTNPRFWALTPYYFIGIPFVLADPGVKFESLPDAEFEGTTYKLLKATFGDGVGDAPDDFYVVYIHPETHEVDAIRYIVSYPGFFPNGGHSPEKLMSYDGALKVGPVTFAQSHRTFKYDVDSGEIGEQVTKIEVSKAEWKKDVKPSLFQPPGGSRIIDGWK